ncbi:MAG TPA: ABC transporter permease [Gemmatimonadaceae bacterium]|nr:ABC transporter permease [Gemmatimonadaceae bacterium]
MTTSRSPIGQKDARRALADRAVDRLRDLALDLRLALRQSRRRPGLAALAITTLAVGIAAVTVTFSLVNTALYRALPYPLAQRTVAIIRTPWDWPGNLPPAAVQGLRHDTRSFARVSAMYDRTERLELPGGVQSLVATAVDTGFFATLGAHPERGRFPSASEIVHAAPYAVISHRLWHGSLNADPAIVGRALRLGTRLYTVVGVMPPHINYGMRGNTDVWVPQPAVADTGQSYFAFAWLRPGVTLQNARAEVRVLNGQLVQSDTARYTRMDLYVNNEMVIRRMDAQGRALKLFLALAGCVLLIACVNVATLLRMRATERRREMAVRASLGAGRGRLVRQGLAESLLFSVAGGGLGLILSAAGIRVFSTSFPGNFPTWVRFGIDAHVALFAVGVSAAVVFLAGLSPALEGLRLDISGMLKSGGSGAATAAHTLRRGHRAVGLQAAVAVALLITTALLGASYLNIATADRGYRPDGVRAAQIWGDSTQEVDARRLVSALSGHPAISLTAWTGNFEQFPDPAAGTVSDSIFRTGTATPVVLDRRVPIQEFSVSERYFATLGIPLLRGRTFAATDTTGHPLVAILSAGLARTLWGGRGDVGRTFQLGRAGPPITVIGVVGDTRQAMRTETGLDMTALPTLYFAAPQTQTQRGLVTVLVRPAASEGAAVAAMHEAARTVVTVAAPPEIRPYVQTIGEAPMIIRVLGIVIGTCAGIALVLALVGIYGVVGYSVAQRTREIGIRVALGGTRGAIRRQVMRGSLRAGAVGIVIGLLLALGLGRLVRAWLLGVSPASPAVYLVTCGVFVAVAYTAGYLPSRRAARVDPMDALRVD